MNRHQQEAKKYLSQAFGLNQRIESKLGQIEDLHDLATKATVTYSDMPKSPNRDGSKVKHRIRHSLLIWKSRRSPENMTPDRTHRPVFCPEKDAIPICSAPVRQMECLMREQEAA